MSARHCLIRQIRAEGQPWLHEVVLGTSTVTFEADGTAKHRESGQIELPEDAGLTAEKRPQRYKIEWKDGPAPSPKFQKLARVAQTRRLEPPNREEVIAAGVADADADKAVAFHKYLHAQGVFPYGVKPLPPAGSEAMLERYLKTKADAAPKAEKAPGEPEADKAKPGKKSHYERRREELAGFVAAPNGGEELRAIAERLGIEFSANKRELADSILAKEHPRDHKPARDDGEE